MKYTIVVGYEEHGLIGIDNRLLIECKDDLRRFYNITTDCYPEGDKNILIMGYNTWRSIPDNVRPFKNRISIVVTNAHSQEITDSDILHATNSLEGAFVLAESLGNGRIFVIGGNSLFQECHRCFSDTLEAIYVTKYQYKYPYKIPNLVQFPEVLLDNTVCHYSSPLSYSLAIVNKPDGFFSTRVYHSLNIYHKKNHVNCGETEYLKLLKKIIRTGDLVESRNSRVYSLFGERMIFNLRDGFPLLTTKKMGYKTILRELLWFLSGSTDNSVLKSKRVHIWDQNASREFLDKRGLDYEEDDLGPVYGFQWRHFGAEYMGRKYDYHGVGYDQIRRVIKQIREEPESRRIILSAWNPPDLDKMALPPCHVLCQFHVNRHQGVLDCQLYQRSGDMFLGVPFNIASYSFLTHIIAKLTDLRAGRLIHILGDAHIYENHKHQVELQLERVPQKFPIITISDECIDIDQIDEHMVKIHGYVSYPKIAADMIA
jgi:dihydrofolate reductase / thymidylate synthase